MMQEVVDKGLRLYLGLDVYNPNQPRDENGRWKKSNNGVAGSKKRGKVKRKERKGLILSSQEYGLIHHSLNDYVANHKDKIGDTITWCVGGYGYRVRIINYNEYVPLKRWRLK